MMIVVDASAVIEVLIGSALGRRLAPRVLHGNPILHAPHLLDLEVLQALRSFLKAKDISPDNAIAAASRLQAFDLVRHPHAPLIQRILDLRHNLTAYDAAYMALAESLDAPLVTCDRALRSVPGARATVEVWE
jgi:predicted nucleic acid-binding protein